MEMASEEKVSQVTVFDVAKYILEKQGEMTAMKLQKLVFYSKAWIMVWDEDELFTEEIQAWANGAVVPELFKKHKGIFKINAAFIDNGDSSKLSDSQKDGIDKVLGYYGKFSAQQLSDINHQESPWIDARRGLHPTQISDDVITPGAMFEYYSGIWTGSEDETEQE